MNDPNKPRVRQVEITPEKIETVICRAVENEKHWVPWRSMKQTKCTVRYVKKALKSNCRYKIIAVGLDKKKNVIHTCTNKDRFPKKGGSLHAEERMMAEAGRDLRYILIFRVGGSGDILPIVPCDRCTKLAKKNNVKIIATYPYYEKERL